MCIWFLAVRQLSAFRRSSDMERIKPQNMLVFPVLTVAARSILTPLETGGLFRIAVKLMMAKSSSLVYVKSGDAILSGHLACLATLRIVLIRQ